MAFANGGRIVTDGLVLSLDAGDRNSYPGSGTTWRDLSGNNNSGSLVNGPTFSSANGGSIVFDGVDDVVTTDLPAGISGIQTCTQVCWFKRTNISTISALVGFGTLGSTSNRYAIQVWSDGLVYVTLGPSDWGYFSSNDTRWHNIQTVFDGTLTGNSDRLKVYFDGVQVSLTFSGTIPSNVGTPLNGCRIGQTFNTGNQYGSSTTSVFQIYNRALSALEILQNYNAQKSRFNL